MKTLLSIFLLLTFGVYAYSEYTPSPEEFSEWKEAAANGDAKAQSALGYMYTNGHGVPQHHAEAFKWYRKAAEQGHANAQYMLGVIHANGNGVKEDKVQAYAWYNIAATNQPLSTRSNIKKDEVAEKMTKEQIVEAQKLSREMIKANPKLLAD